MSSFILDMEIRPCMTAYTYFISLLLILHFYITLAVFKISDSRGIIMKKLTFNFMIMWTFLIVSIGSFWIVVVSCL